MTLPATANSIQIAEVDLAILTDPTNMTYVWTQISDVIEDSTTIDPAVAGSFGWERIYTPCFIASNNSVIGNDATGVNIAFTVSNVGETAADTNYQYSPAIVELRVDF